MCMYVCMHIHIKHMCVYIYIYIYIYGLQRACNTLRVVISALVYRCRRSSTLRRYNNTIHSSSNDINHSNMNNTNTDTTNKTSNDNDANNGNTSSNSNSSNTNNQPVTRVVAARAPPFCNMLQALVL